MKLLFSHPIARLGIFAAIGASSFVAASKSHGQLFGDRGLFGGREAPIRSLTEEEIGVPFPKTGRVQAVKGQEVRFEIQAISKAPGAAVEFLIRTMPTAGKIVSLVENPNARNRAIVTYYADPSTSAESDVFGFAVRYRGGRYSSEMRFDIDLVDVKAEIQAEPEIDFGETMVGEEVVREIPVRNLGTGEFRRQIYLTAPWRIVEPANGMLLIQPKQTKMVKVGFRPTAVGDTSYFLSFSRTKGAMTKMIGSGSAPFALATEEVRLTHDPKTGIRSGEVVVKNSTGKPLRLALRGSSRIQKSLPEMVLLPPDEPYSIGVEIPETDVNPFDGMLQMYQEAGYGVSARLVAAVVPGKLEIAMPGTKAVDVINYGRVSAGKTTERGFRLTNTGGVAVPLEFHIPDPFRLLTDPGPQLAPQASVNLAVGVFPAASKKGPIDVTMNVFGADQSLPIRLLANVVSPENGVAPANPPRKGILDRLGGLRMSSGKPKPGEVSTFVPPEIGNGEANSGGFTIGNKPESAEILPGIDIYPLVERQQNPELRSPEDLAVVEAGSSSLTLGWTAPPNSQLNDFEIELLGMVQDGGDGFPRSVWLPMREVEFERVDRLVKARMTGLQPNSAYYIRVFTLDENGRASNPSEAMEVLTELPMDWTYIYLSFLIAFVALLGFGVWKVIQGRRPEVYRSKYVDA
ncbi:MAG: fibronectin type III domain-containing protein [Verrucomicrobiales bacterium]|nr:fibronectin type III domain-containing protein [Verrucomicrobiales bacterium]